MTMVVGIVRRSNRKESGPPFTSEAPRRMGPGFRRDDR